MQRDFHSLVISVEEKVKGSHLNLTVDIIKILGIQIELAMKCNISE